MSIVRHSSKFWVSLLIKDGCVDKDKPYLWFFLVEQKVRIGHEGVHSRRHGGDHANGEVFNRHFIYTAIIGHPHQVLDQGS